MNLAIENGGSFHSYVTVYQRVSHVYIPKIHEYLITTTDICNDYPMYISQKSMNISFSSYHYNHFSYPIWFQWPIGRPGGWTEREQRLHAAFKIRDAGDPRRERWALRLGQWCIGWEKRWAFQQNWLWINTYRYIAIVGWTSINPSYDLGFTRYQGFDPSPTGVKCALTVGKCG